MIFKKQAPAGRPRRPELLLLAAFADYGEKPAATVFAEVITAVKDRSESKIDFDLFMNQLHIFSKLHNSTLLL